MQSSGGTIMIDEIRQEALEKARTRLAFLFSDAQSLDNTSIAVIRSQLTKSLAQAESNINMIVQTKLDSLKRVVDLMEDSSTKLDMFTTNLIKIDERIATTHSTLSDYQHLKNVCMMCRFCVILFHVNALVGRQSERQHPEAH